jgi:anaerobic selenocysteine-containing dehydrogenase
MPDLHLPGRTALTPMRSKAVWSKDLTTASWHEFWINNEDASQFGIKDGDLLRVSNPVGAVRVIARVTSRIVRGHAQLHHGALYDPNPVDGVDDGGNAGTLTTSRPSKLDTGNALHCAYAVVEKEISF